MLAHAQTVCTRLCFPPTHKLKEPGSRLNNDEMVTSSMNTPDRFYTNLPHLFVGQANRTDPELSTESLWHRDEPMWDDREEISEHQESISEGVAFVTSCHFCGYSHSNILRDKLHAGYKLSLNFSLLLNTAKESSIPMLMLFHEEVMKMVTTRWPCLLSPPPMTTSGHHIGQKRNCKQLSRKIQIWRLYFSGWKQKCQVISLTMPAVMYKPCGLNVSNLWLEMESSIENGRKQMWQEVTNATPSEIDSWCSEISSRSSHIGSSRCHKDSVESSGSVLLAWPTKRCGRLV